MEKIGNLLVFCMRMKLQILVFFLIHTINSYQKIIT